MGLVCGFVLSVRAPQLSSNWHRVALDMLTLRSRYVSKPEVVRNFNFQVMIGVQPRSFFKIVF